MRDQAGRQRGNTGFNNNKKKSDLILKIDWFIKKIKKKKKKEKKKKKNETVGPIKKKVKKT